MELRVGHGILPLLLAGMVSACVGSESTTTTTTTTTPAPAANVSGVVLAGPTCPVATPEEPCPPRPVADAEIEAQNPAGEAVAHTRTDAHGRYAIALDPGAYTLIATTSPGGPMSCDPVSVTVSAGSGPAPAAERVDISCDTGIR